MYKLGQDYWDKRARDRGRRAVGHVASPADTFETDTDLAWQTFEPYARHYDGLVLDFGAGWGRFTTRLAQLQHTIAVDGSREMCAMSGGRVQHVPPGQLLPFEDDNFRGLFIYAVLQHIPDTLIDQQCTELRRVLGPGAYMIVCDAVGPAYQSALGHSVRRPLSRYQELLPGLRQREIVAGTYQPTLLTGQLEDT